MKDKDIDMDQFICGESMENDSNNLKDEENEIIQNDNLNNNNEKNNYTYNNNSKNNNLIIENSMIKNKKKIIEKPNKSDIINYNDKNNKKNIFDKSKKIENNVEKPNSKKKNIEINRNDDNKEDVSINNSMDNDDDSINNSMDIKNENNNNNNYNFSQIKNNIISNENDFSINNTMLKKIDKNKDNNKKQENIISNDNEINTNKKKQNKKKKNKSKKKINKAKKINYEDINIKAEVEEEEKKEMKKKEKNDLQNLENSNLIHNKAFFDPDEDNDLLCNNKNYQPIIDDFFMDFSQNIVLLNKKYNLNNNEKLFYIYDENNIHFLTQPLSCIEVLNSYVQKRFNIDKVKFRLIDFFYFYGHEPYSFQSIKIILNKNWVDQIILNPIVGKVFNQNIHNQEIKNNFDLSEIKEKFEYSAWTIDFNNYNNKENALNYKINEKKNENDYDNEGEWKLIEKKKNKIEKENKEKKENKENKEKIIVGLDIKKQNKNVKDSDNLEDLLKPKRFNGVDTTSYGKFLAFRQFIPIEIEDSRKNKKKNKK